MKISHFAKNQIFKNSGGFYENERLTIMLLTAAMLTSCLLPLAGYKKGETTPENPFAVDGTNDQQGTDPNAGWTPGAVNGEKMLYGKDSAYSGILRYGDMMIGMTNYSNCYGYYSIDDPHDAKLICFDPLCLHLPQQDSCPAVINSYIGEFGETYDYPYGMYIDLYENSESPVIYLYYLRDDIYAINIEEIGHRDPVYCIERYDLSKGKREVVLDNVENTIQQAGNYGDYVYYVLDMGEEKGQALYRIHKSGGEPQKYDRKEKAESIRITDVVNDMFFYTVDERYVYRANLDLTESEMVLDMSTVKGQNGSNGVIQGSYSGYLYYFADVETVWAGTPQESTSAEKCNLYRIPMNDLAKTPEKMVEGMLISRKCYYFTEGTLYYEPCVFKYIQEMENSELTKINTCDGKLFALDLKTGESKTIVEDSGMTIYPACAWDDLIIFSGWAYDPSGIENSGSNSNFLIAYTSGEPYEIWCKGGPGMVTEEYLAALREVTNAAREAYEASKNAS